MNYGTVLRDLNFHLSVLCQKNLRAPPVEKKLSSNERA